MDIFIYSDESGVLDKTHDRYFVYGGIILIGAEERNKWSRHYSKAEKAVRKSKGVGSDYELKATNLTNGEKSKLFRSLNNCFKFSVIISQSSLLDSIFAHKKTKQRYLDYAYKIAVKRALSFLCNSGRLNPSEVENIYFCVDEHITATDGRYELREALEQELKYGTHNYKYDKFFPPLFPNMGGVILNYCNSKKNYLVRASDIIANRVYYLATSEQKQLILNIREMNPVFLP